MMMMMMMMMTDAAALFLSCEAQNGLDNSGDTSHYRWIGNYSSSGAAIYEHWTMRGGDWVGIFNNNWGVYESINQEYIIDTLKVIDTIIEKYKDNAAVIGLEPGSSSDLLLFDLR